jgi:hypothetical protein
MHGYFELNVGALQMLFACDRTKTLNIIMTNFTAANQIMNFMMVYLYPFVYQQVF